MADGWEYAVISLFTGDDGLFTGWLVLGSQEPQELHVPRLRDRLAVLNSLGREGWEVVNQSTTETRNGEAHSAVYGWEYLLKRRL
jgi:hypothetical protein